MYNLSVAAKKKNGGSGVPGPNLIVTKKCDRRCAFCLAHDGQPAMSAGLIRAALARRYDTISFAGGEPLLCADLEKWARAAAAGGTRYMLVLTNGLNLTDGRRASLLAAGIKHFHFNFPSHLERTHDLLTGTAGKLGIQTDAIRKTAAAGPQLASVGCVVNSLNYRELPGYVAYAARNFPGLFYLEFHFVKVAGRVRGNEGLVPDLRKVRPYLVRALRAAEKLGLKCVADGFPLCFLKGVEKYSREAWHLYNGDHAFLNRSAPLGCPPCGLSGLCTGPSPEYARLRGRKGFRPAPAGAAAPLLRYFRDKDK